MRGAVGNWMSLRTPDATQGTVLKNVKSVLILGGLSALRLPHYLLLGLMNNIKQTVEYTEMGKCDNFRRWCLKHFTWRGLGRDVDLECWGLPFHCADWWEDTWKTILTLINSVRVCPPHQWFSAGGTQGRTSTGSSGVLEKMLILLCYTEYNYRP